MNATLITVPGTIKPDGSLELEGRVPLPAGPVLVTVQPVPQPPPGDPFWTMMERIWADQKARRHVPRSVEEVEAERNTFRDEWDERQVALEQIHLEGERLRQAKQPKEPGK